MCNVYNNSINGIFEHIFYNECNKVIVHISHWTGISTTIVHVWGIDVNGNDTRDFKKGRYEDYGNDTQMVWS